MIYFSIAAMRRLRQAVAFQEEVNLHVEDEMSRCEDFFGIDYNDDRQTSVNDVQYK